MLLLYMCCKDSVFFYQETAKSAFVNDVKYRSPVTFTHSLLLTVFCDYYCMHCHINFAFPSTTVYVIIQFLFYSTLSIGHYEEMYFEIFLSGMKKCILGLHTVAWTWNMTTLGLITCFFYTCLVNAISFSEGSILKTPIKFKHVKIPSYLFLLQLSRERNELE